MSTMVAPARSYSSLRAVWVARTEPLPGSASPIASVRQFIEFAVNMPEQEPQVGHAFSSIESMSASDTDSSTASAIALTRSRLFTVPSVNTARPDSMGPPDTKTVGMLRRSAASSMPGVILSQLEMHTSASAQWALAMYSTLSAMMSRLGSEYSIPPWPIAIPSSTAIVLNSRATAPALWIASETMRPTGARWVWPGTNSVKELATAMIGLPMSWLATPDARMSARAPAMLRPWVTVRERSAGMSLVKHAQRGGCC